ADPNRGRRRLDSGGQMKTEQVQVDRTREMLNQAVSDVGPDIIRWRTKQNQKYA
ncbi:hypothetical protein Tco_0614133, partial [Tanacetum coccineum]